MGLDKNFNGRKSAQKTQKSEHDIYYTSDIVFRWRSSCVCAANVLSFSGNSMKARVKWIENVSFVGESGSGHSVIMDGAPDAGGRNLGFRPMEMLLLGLGGCSAFDVVMILKRGRERVTDCVVEIDAERAETEPKIFTKIALRYIITGHELDPKKVERAVSLSADKYCSATAIMNKTAQISHAIEIVGVPTV
jgi:putative redox protein